MLFIIPPVLGATDTETISINKTLQPVQGDWYYQERNMYMDFEEFLEGSSPNLTTYMGAGDYPETTGVYRLASPYLEENDEYNVTEGPNLEELSDLSIYIPNRTTSNYNISGANWENITINSNTSISVNTSGHYDGGYTWLNNTIGASPSDWDVSAPGGYVRIEEETSNHKNIVALNRGSSSATMNKSFDNPVTSGKIEYWIYFDAISQYDAFPNIRTDSGTTIIYVWCQTTNRFQVYDGASALTMYFQNGTQIVRQNNVWYRMKLEFNCVGDFFYWSIATHLNPTYERMYENGGGLDYTLPFTSNVTDLSDIQFYSFSSGGQFHIDTIDTNHYFNYFENRLNYTLDSNGFYESDIFEFNYTCNVYNVSLSSQQYLNSSITVEIADNGTFNNWVDYSIYNATSISEIKYRIFFNQSNAFESSILNSIVFNTSYSYPINPFMNELDQYLLISPVKNFYVFPYTTKYEYQFNVSENGGFTNFEMEFLFVHVFYPNFSQSSLGPAFYFYTYIDDTAVSYISFNINNPYTNENGDIRYSSYGTVNQVYTDIYHYHQSPTNDFYFMIYDVSIIYNHNSSIRYIVSYWDENNELTEFIDSEGPIPPLTPTEVNWARLVLRNYGGGGGGTVGQSIMLSGIDSSRMHVDYERHQLLENITKNITCYNVETIYAYSITSNPLFLSPSISKIEIYSEMSNYEFISFICKAKGNQYVTQTFTNINTYQTVSSSLYDDNLQVFYLNVKYRCKNINEFNNTIYLRITRIYTPWTPGISDLFLLVIPNLICLFVPSAVGYYKFGKNGFLIIFTLMTLLSMAIGWLPLVPGLLIITLLVIVFLGIMKKQAGGGNNGN